MRGAQLELLCGDGLMHHGDDDQELRETRRLRRLQQRVVTLGPALGNRLPLRGVVRREMEKVRRRSEQEFRPVVAEAREDGVEHVYLHVLLEV